MHLTFRSRFVNVDESSFLQAITFVTEQDKVLLRHIAEIVRESEIAQHIARQQSGIEASDSSSDATAAAPEGGFKGGLGSLQTGRTVGGVKVSDSISLPSSSIPQWMLELPRASISTLKKLQTANPVRPAINTENREARRKENRKKALGAGKGPGSGKGNGKGKSGKDGHRAAGKDGKVPRPQMEGMSPHWQKKGPPKAAGRRPQQEGDGGAKGEGHKKGSSKKRHVKRQKMFSSFKPDHA